LGGQVLPQASFCLYAVAMAKNHRLLHGRYAIGVFFRLREAKSRLRLGVPHSWRGGCIAPCFLCGAFTCRCRPTTPSTAVPDSVFQTARGKVTLKTWRVSQLARHLHCTVALLRCTQLQTTPPLLVDLIKLYTPAAVHCRSRKNMWSSIIPVPSCQQFNHADVVL